MKIKRRPLTRQKFARAMLRGYWSLQFGRQYFPTSRYVCRWGRQAIQIGWSAYLSAKGNKKARFSKGAEAAFEYYYGALPHDNILKFNAEIDRIFKQL